jgi:hypothetical protein
MPQRRYQLAMGAKAPAVAESTPTAFGTNLVRLDVDFTAAMTRQNLLEAVDEIRTAILEGAWPPA